MKFAQFIPTDIDIRNFRSTWMGIAIIWIFFFHSCTALPVIRYGWMGVDIFFFLSGIGLCYSFTKNSNVQVFYCKRFLRIIPTWWFMILSLLVLKCIITPTFTHPHNFFDWFCYLTGLGWWLSDFTGEIFASYYEWYIPTLLLYYLIFPLLWKAGSLFRLILIFIWEFFIWFLIYHDTCPNLSALSLDRFSVFLWGMIYYDYMLGNYNEKLKTWFPIFSILLSIMLFLCGIVRLHYYIILLLPIAMKAMQFIACKLRVCCLLNFMGLITMELYLIHVYWNFPSLKVFDIVIPQDFMSIPKFILCIIIAYTIHTGIEVIMRFAKRHFNIIKRQ